ncbi:MAG: hypothetical protein ACD_28C00325G0004 [uncultured bacterium]|nr:MAG: hypothetical protein ACD_28C00325G0004 [uncultured bacterium]KKT74950.1 MAG: hypothetical protein UW70_C0042G0008 [Candidatus Peregrinibacteria bacterium GW2011_GWA2_44_7]
MPNLDKSEPLYSLMRLGSHGVQKAAGKGPLVGLIKRGAGLDPEVQRSLAVIQSSATSQLAKGLERFTSGALSVDLAADFSGSTTELHASLLKLSGELASRLAGSLPLAQINYGIFGGEGLVQARGGVSLLGQAHCSTAGWESSFGQFLERYRGLERNLQRQDVLISFHDARPKQDASLFESIKVLNQTNGIAVIIYLPSSGSTDADRQVLRDLASPETGFKRGLFIDLSGVDYKDPTILGGFIRELVEGVAQTNREAAQAGQHPEITGEVAHTRFRALAGTVLQRAKQLSAKSSPLGLLGDGQ